MKIYKSILLIVTLALINPACTLLEPENDNHNTLDRVYRDPSFAEGLLIRAYTLIPTNNYNFDDVATDDAVSNDRLNNFMRIATGEWTARFNPQNVWDNGNLAILYINQFLTIVDDVPWKWTNPEVAQLYIRRLKGESYAMRALFKYFLIRNHGGVGANGELLGTPVYNEFLENREDFSAPRPSFQVSLESIYADIAESLKYLPMDYGQRTTLPTGFESVSDITNYNEVFGNYAQQRMSGRHALTIRARAALLAASPAFNPNNEVKRWEDAANYLGQLLVENGGIAGIDPLGHTFYLGPQVDAADLTANDLKDLGEIMWRRPMTTDRDRETANFPPSLYGNGRINPTQNLVDAFPGLNGYPITDTTSRYSAANPYANRDPRLALYIVTNGSRLRNTVINTAQGSGDNGIDALPTSTRTGYYLKKLMREDVNVNPAAASNQRHYNTHMRFTELYLSFAEAANEAWGPNSGGTVASFTPMQVVAAIRKRAGITQPDPYLNTVNTKEAFRTLVRNERRLELCFEGHRFWDLRRWKEDLTKPARGVRISGTTFTYFDVEARSFDNAFMHYGPIPDREITKFALVQNKGW